MRSCTCEYCTSSPHPSLTPTLPSIVLTQDDHTSLILFSDAAGARLFVHPSEPREYKGRVDQKSLWTKVRLASGEVKSVLVGSAKGWRQSMEPLVCKFPESFALMQTTALTRSEAARATPLAADAFEGREGEDGEEPPSPLPLSSLKWTREGVLSHLVSSLKRGASSFPLLSEVLHVQRSAVRGASTLRCRFADGSGLPFACWVPLTILCAVASYHSHVGPYLTPPTAKRRLGDPFPSSGKRLSRT